ncbi:MAG: hypothetical protein GWN87_32465, partial [Desulfuromonadales bacterium]|nr:hypothetical protein [Desulfuromonadales bacterium]NIS44190.1 hypothetical protein [Desulfuromonadales bacterium]
RGGKIEIDDIRKPAATAENLIKGDAVVTVGVIEADDETRRLGSSIRVGV